MTPLIQTCVVIVTLAIVALVVFTIRTLFHLSREAARLTSAAQLSMAQVERIVLETQALLEAAREIVAPARQVSQRFHRLGERAADLSTAVFEEIETPLLNAVAIARGVHFGTRRLFELLARRVALHPTTHNGDPHHE